MITILTILLGAATASRVALAGSAFAGCFDGVPNGYTHISSEYSMNDCQSTCSSEKTQYTYALWKPFGSCFCGNSYPLSIDIEHGSPDSCADEDHVEMRMIDTPFDMEEGCVDSVELLGGPEGMEVESVDECLTRCLHHPAAVFEVNPRSSTGYKCSCGTPYNIGASAICSADSQWLYTQKQLTSSLTIQPSRKNKNRVDTHEKQKAASVCPLGLTPCLVQGLESLEYYECIDISISTDSCGGCPYKTFGQPAAPLGKDCNSAPGVSYGSATCNQGQCIAKSCQRGFRLSKGRCIK
ncbi:hypothetical protein CI109_103208 [Kwoniella shandongensis]|uniref:Uncharacterized protein n=1 Tax=Kwoniella shandongensis TaxID=1734106 RepID=A0A5M6CDM7_9TREE|nr:uncharacterized protein CI109_000398 [Kwoniella shandongensis]KAA5531555.1 hypothetical protein CI109_000398 [Kwoniella shandongensis]